MPNSTQAKKDRSCSYTQPHNPSTHDGPLSHDNSVRNLVRLQLPGHVAPTLLSRGRRTACLRRLGIMKNFVVACHVRHAMVSVTCPPRSRLSSLFFG